MTVQKDFYVVSVIASETPVSKTPFYTYADAKPSLQLDTSGT